MDKSSWPADNKEVNRKANEIYNFDKLSNYSHEIVVGFKWMTEHGGLIEFGVIENIIETYNSPDVGLHFAYAYRFWKEIWTSYKL